MNVKQSWDEINKRVSQNIANMVNQQEICNHIYDGEGKCKLCGGDYYEELMHEEYEPDPDMEYQAIKEGEIYDM